MWLHLLWLLWGIVDCDLGLILLIKTNYKLLCHKVIWLDWNIKSHYVILYPISKKIDKIGWDSSFGDVRCNDSDNEQMVYF